MWRLWQKMNNIIKETCEQISLIKISHPLTCSAMLTPCLFLLTSQVSAALGLGLLQEVCGRVRGGRRMHFTPTLKSFPFVKKTNTSFEPRVSRSAKIQAGEKKATQSLLQEKPPAGARNGKHTQQVTREGVLLGDPQLETRDPSYKVIFWGFLPTDAFQNAGTGPAGDSFGSCHHILFLLPEPCLASLAGDLCPSLPSRPDESLPGWQRSQWYSSHRCLNLLL